MAAPSIAVFTGGRADYGLLRGTIRELQARNALMLLVSGTHLSAEFGGTLQQIEADGFPVSAEIPIMPEGDDAVAVARATGLGTAAMAETLHRLRPDALVVLGDRYEALAAAQAALLLSIPIAHIHGGELTEGAIDDQIRHAITKMATLHFAAAEPYRRRIIQMGEQPDHVFDVGSPGVQNVAAYRRLDRAAFTAATGFAFGAVNLLATYHPLTTDPELGEAGMDALCQALDRFPEARVLFTRPNADAGGRAINARIEAFALERRDRVMTAASLGAELYPAALGLFDAVVGNSSSGIIEAPAAGIPTVNIGGRQKGRLRAASVIDCGEDPRAIEAAIRTALQPDFRSRAVTQPVPYGRGDTARRIAEILTGFPWSRQTGKKFYDLP